MGISETFKVEGKKMNRSTSLKCPGIELLDLIIKYESHGGRMSTVPKRNCVRELFFKRTSVYTFKTSIWSMIDLMWEVQI